MTIEELQKKADYIRNEVIRVACKNKCGHIAPSLSTVDILVALYYEIMQPFKHRVAQSYFIQPKHFQDRDRLVLSKGHGCYALYAILADLGIIPKDAWEDFGLQIRPYALKGCVEYMPAWGLEAGTGSLGHGLPMAVGMAYAAKILKLPWHTYCIIGDGELQEGSCWEALNFMFEQELKNIMVIVDRNGFMALQGVPNIAWDYLNFDSIIVNGHDLHELLTYIAPGQRIIIANTVKGKGLKCMEGVAHFHYRVPCEDELCEGRTYGN